MSELKIYYSPNPHCTNAYYLKSEADKVIAELKEKYKELAKLHDKAIQACCDADKVIAELKKERNWLAKDRAQAYDDLEKRAQLNIKQEESIRHHKYKRCLTMAKWCYSMDCKMLDEAADNGTYFKESWCWKRALWYGKWKRKWLELAEKFKEG